MNSRRDLMAGTSLSDRGGAHAAIASLTLQSAILCALLEPASNTGSIGCSNRQNDEFRPIRKNR
jgi:hypothetical protein